MGVPKNIGALLGTIDPAACGGTTFAVGVQCEGSSFHSPNPLVLREVDLGGRKALLCSTCADNLSLLDNLHRTYGGDLAWNVRREFGNKIRALHQEMTGG